MPHNTIKPYITHTPCPALAITPEQFSNHPHLHAFLLLLALLLVALLETASAQSAQVVGGPCQYADFPGKIKILSVKTLPQPANLQTRLPYQPYEVFFSFTPAKNTPESQTLAGRSHSLTLSGGTPPGPEFLRKYKIRQGATFACEGHIITKGTCSPVVFTLHGIDVFDHSELKANGR